MGFRVWGLGLKVKSLGFRAWGLGFVEEALELKATGLVVGVGVKCFGFRVSG